jgi:arylsulfatase A-like enzyme
VNLFDSYETRSRAASEQDMNIENTMKERWDLKIATPEELRDTTLKDKFYEAYHRMTPEEQKRWDEAYAPRITEFRENKLTGKELVRWKYQQYMRDYLATTLAVDDNVGRLLKYLEDIGELDNTIIVYTSDQGFFLGEHGWFDKRFMYEECQRMPLLVRYPKLIHPGSKSDALCMNVDFAPTLLDMAGVKVPDDMQGKSLLSVLKNNGETPYDWRKAVYYHYYEYPAEHSVKRHYGIRTQDFKLIHFYNDIDEWEMYDLQKDPLEMNNVYNNQLYNAKRNELMQLLKQMRANYHDTSE